MKLKQFLVRCPYVPHEDKLSEIMKEYGVDYAEAKKIDYQKNHKGNAVKMRDYTRCVTAMLERYYIPITTEKYWEIIVNILKPEDKDFRENSSGGVLETYCTYDYEKLFELDDFDIKKVILDLVESTVTSVMKEHNWDFESFKDACNSIRDNNYQNDWVWKKKRNKSFIAEVCVKHDVKKAKIFLNIKKSSGEMVKEHQIAESPPIEFVFFQYFGDLTWESDTCVTLTTKNGEVFKTEIEG